MYTDLGTEYRGSQSTAASGKLCKEWDSLTVSEIKKAGVLPNDDARNYCRNPDSRPNGPWCYLEGSLEEEWEYCDIPICKPSSSCKQTTFGEEYVGTVSQTRTGRVCQRWDRQAPHSHDWTDSDSYPDDTLAEASNYCRNPGGSQTNGPWCYTTDPQIEWEYCSLSICQDCKSGETGRDYNGILSRTSSGLDCQRWDEQFPHAHTLTDPNRFPDKDLAAANNYCRNPDNDPQGPWCFTTDEFVVRDYCDITECTGTGSQPKVPLAQHVVQLGIDGLKPSCMLDAPGGVPNMMDRLAAFGSYTLDRARTVLVTVSGPGWSAQLCGNAHEHTGITGNGWIPPWSGSDEDITPMMGPDVTMPCVFQELKSRDVNIRTASLYDWNWIKYMSNRGYPGMVDYELYGPLSYEIEDVYLAGNASDYLRNILLAAEKSYTFVYLGDVDSKGHSFTWCSDEYLQAVANSDEQIGWILDVIDELGMADEVLVTLSTDHGGLDFGHGRYADSDIMIPMFVRGPGVRVNHQFEFEVENKQMVPTAFHVLGFKPSRWWKGQIMDEAFEED